MICTSYFAKLKDLPPNLAPVSICAKTPLGVKGKMPEYWQLAPPAKILAQYKEDGDVEHYTKEYQSRVLGKLNSKQIAHELEEYAKSRGKDGVCLFCYEKTGDFCHRHLVAQWLTKNGFICKELQL